jgi:hypothetical protein
LGTGDAPANVMGEGVGVKVFHPFQKGPVRAGNVIGLHKTTPLGGIPLVFKPYRPFREQYRPFVL